MKKISIIIMLVLTGVFAQAQSVWDGSRQLWTRGTGTQDDPFLIESAANLAYLSYMVGKAFNTEGLYFKLTTDIDLNGSEDLQWIPIGMANDAYYEDGCERNTIPVCVYDRSNFSFKGHFDGADHRISNLYINKESGSVGLFGVLTGSYDSENLTVVENVFVTSGYVKGSYSGGIVGNVSSNTDNCLISRCLNGAEIEGTNAGGIVGGSFGVVQNCNNFGNVTGSSSAGGIVGEAAQSIVECFNTGTINSQGTVGGMLGGSARVNSLIVENCYNTGEVSSTGEISLYGNSVGGLVGFVRRGNSSMVNCYNTGNVASSFDEQPGALVGSFNGEVTNSYYLNDCGGAGEGESKSADEMRDPSFVNVLNFETDVWCADTLNSNNGYPILGANNLSVNEHSIAALKVYPNPSNGHFTVEGTGSLSVYNALGQIVLVRDIRGQVDLELPQGLYFMRLEGDSVIKATKVLIR